MIMEMIGTCFIERHGDTVRVAQKDGQVVIERIHKKQIRM